MSIRQHGPHLYQLTRFGSFNSYLLRDGDTLTAIDTGLSGARTITHAARLIGLPITRLLITHAHADHASDLDTLHTQHPDLSVLLLTPLPAHVPSLPAWLAFLYISVFSMFLGFFAWYRGLALGGVAHAGQAQLIQPALTLGWAALLLGEHLTLPTLMAALLIIACAALSRLTR